MIPVNIGLVYQGLLQYTMLNRRNFIRHAGHLASGGIVGSSLLNQITQTQTETRAPDFRIAHLTDMHVMPDGAMSVNAQAGFIRALEHSQNLSRKPDLI